MNDRPLHELRELIHHGALLPERQLLPRLIDETELDAAARLAISQDAEALVTALRRDAPITFLQSFLTEYGLSNSEGIALMCLAEAFLRVPDVDTLDQLIAEKITSSNWRAHAGQASAFLVNASTWGLMLSGRLLSAEEDEGLARVVQRLLSRLGEPLVRVAMTEVMERMGEHFVIGESIQQAIKHSLPWQEQGYCFSFDMLGEAVRTERDAQRCYASYAKAITAISADSGRDIRDNPGISVKLSALHPRFELLQKPRMFDALVDRVASLAASAARHNLGFTIDAEEAERLEITLDLMAAVLGRGDLRQWDGFGVVVQAYSKRAPAVIDWLHALARERRCKLSVRLVKGAYWDTEIKRAQVLGLSDYPVFTRKAATDISYLAAARRLLSKQDFLYPQFATHNAHTLTAVMRMAGERGDRNFELQRLHGMGETLHQKIMSQSGTRHRIYAPVGEHRDLLAYLVRRLLENGANNSFVHQIRDHRVAVSEVAADPVERIEQAVTAPQPKLSMPREIFAPRVNSPGWDLSNPIELARMDRLRRDWRGHSWTVETDVGNGLTPNPPENVLNPSCESEVVGTVATASSAQVESALDTADRFRADWAAVSVQQRAATLRRAADLLEENVGEALALLCREAGKTVPDGLGEWREAIDFLRYYADRAELSSREGRGVIVCISPWNFPLAIFIGQIAAALAAGNVVIAKPAEQTPIVAGRAVQWLIDAGVPKAALQVLYGDGARLGNVLCRDAKVNGVCFTGSLATAQLINRTVSDALPVDATFIAETGGINAMVVDSTALPEQTIRDVVTSAFNSAGQRCSALRILYLQEEIADEFLAMLIGAMDELKLGDPWELDTDIGPVIDEAAARQLRAYIDQQDVMHQLAAVPAGNFVAPTLIRVQGIESLADEIFGPVLHVATFAASQLDQVIGAINASGYGLTFAIHSRLRERVDACVAELAVGNIYVNRNQIGAVVGSQPFGGEGMSGTGPKAGGPHYVQALQRESDEAPSPAAQADRPGEGDAPLPVAEREELQSLADRLGTPRPAAGLDRLAHLQPYCSAELLACLQEFPAEQYMPGPTGEENQLSLRARGVALCLGPTPELALQQAIQALAFGGRALVCCRTDGALEALLETLPKQDPVLAVMEATVSPGVLQQLRGIDLVAFVGPADTARAMRKALAARAGKIIPLVCEPIAPAKYFTERHVCTDTTAAGGNVTLMAAAE